MRSSLLHRTSQRSWRVLPKLAVVVAMIILFSRSVFAGLDATYQFWVFGVLAILSMAFGASGGLLQRSYSRMLAYSGVAQIGYALVAVALGAPAMTPAALLVTAYALAAAAAFLAAGAFQGHTARVGRDHRRACGVGSGASTSGCRCQPWRCSRSSACH
jgi:NADH:ubiquinone oxidoreductase subunit 2 (subunit N)